MRGFFILLLLTNLAYFAWQAYLGSAEVVSHPASLDQDHSLILLSELPSSEHPRSRSVAIVEQESSEPSPHKLAVPAMEDQMAELEPSVQCLRHRNIEVGVDLDQVIARLKSAGARHIEQGEEAGVRINYWVVMPSHVDRASAERSAAMLRERAVRDFFIIRTGEHENAISLGVFSTRARAERRLAQITELGLNVPAAKIDTMELPARMAWLAYQIDTSEEGRVAEAMEGVAIPAGQRIECESP